MDHNDSTAGNSEMLLFVPYVMFKDALVAQRI